MFVSDQLHTPTAFTLGKESVWEWWNRYKLLITFCCQPPTASSWTSKFFSSLLTGNSTVVTQDKNCILERHEFKNFVKVLRQISISLPFMQNRWYLLTESGELQRSDPVTRAAKTVNCLQLLVSQPENARDMSTLVRYWHTSPIFSCVREYGMQLHFCYMEICLSIARLQKYNLNIWATSETPVSFTMLHASRINGLFNDAINSSDSDSS
jgi:hypothetical protein